MFPKKSEMLLQNILYFIFFLCLSSYSVVVVYCCLKYAFWLWINVGADSLKGSDFRNCWEMMLVVTLASVCLLDNEHEWYVKDLMRLGEMSLCNCIPHVGSDWWFYMKTTSVQKYSEVVTDWQYFNTKFYFLGPFFLNKNILLNYFSMYVLYECSTLQSGAGMSP